MIFVTVGSMLPFDRLIKAMDAWAVRHPEEKLFAQIGDGSYLPQNIPYARIITPSRFREIYEEATLIVAHAGMGSVISAASIGKSIVLVPRLAGRKEHTTDHQVHTAGRLRGRPGIFIADSDDDLDSQIENARASIQGCEKIVMTAPADFVTRIHNALIS